MKISLKKAVHTHYNDRQLSKENLAVLKKQRDRAVSASLNESAPLNGSASSKKFLSPKIWKSMVAAAAVAVLFLPFGFNILKHIQLEDQILNEVVYNHTRQMNPEIKTASLDSVQNYLSRLEFQLIQSPRLSKNEWVVLGGRYCSIQGRLAALIQVKNIKSGMICSYYQVPLPEGFSSDDQMTEKFLNGMKVNVWSEKGLLLALVGPDTASV